MFVYIQGWDYMLSKLGNSYTLWHHVTPADGGYGTEVRESFIVGQYTKDSVGQLYSYISSKHVSPSEGFYNKSAEIDALKNAMERLGLFGE